MRVEAFIPVVALMALQGASAAPVNQNREQFEKRWCLLGFIGTSCGGSSNAVTTSSAVAKASSTSAAPVASSAKASSSASSSAAATKITSSSAVAAKSATITITTAAATSTAAWSSCKDFDWTAFNGWSWGGYGIDYVKAWYLDVYGLNPPANMNWHQVSALVSSFGQKTVAAGPKATSSYHRGCSNPWTSKTGPTSTAVVVSTSTAPAATSKAASSSNAAAAVASASASASKSSAVVSSSAAASTSTSKSSAAASSVVASSAAATSVAAAPAATSSAAVSSASASSSAAAVSASPAVASSASSASSVASAAGTTVASVTSSAAAQATDAATTVAGGSATGVPGTGSGSNNATGTASSAASAATTSAAVVINGYESGGCVQEVSGRLLSKVQTSSSTMTVEQCTSLCMSYGFGVAGVEYGNECYCGVTDDLANTAVSGQCYMPCAGDSTETCGGPNALNIYVNEDIQPATTVLPTGWTTYGVVSEGTNGRALTYTLWSKNDNTVESCAQGCAAAGYSIAGTEYSSECYCGNSFSNGGGAIQDSSAAFMACSGNLAEMCGGPSILSVVTSLSGTIPSS